jgi:putative tryptophan/tyrosine transport system substrate-binding protein
VAKHGGGCRDQHRPLDRPINALEMRWLLAIDREPWSGDERGAEALEYATTCPTAFVEILNASSRSEIDAAFATIVRERADALFIAPDAFFTSRRGQFATLAARDRVPTSGGNREMTEAGPLMSYGANLVDMFRQVGVYTGNILKGAKPAELPVLQSTKFELVFNLKTAKALGLTIPETLLVAADEVIE